MEYMKRTLGLFLIIFVLVGTVITACGFLGFGGTTWKEEVLQYDGRKVIVQRSLSYGGRHEIGQPSPIKEQTISFTLPTSKKTVKWTSEYSDDVGRANFNLLALHILNDTPYIVASPNLCLSYNKWGRPNPPYVFFKYDGKAWQRIPLEEFPAEFKTLNVCIYLGGRDVKEMVDRGLVTAEQIRQSNSSLTQPEYKTILREPLAEKEIACTEMIRVKDGWVGIEWFTSQPTYERCLNVCRLKKIDAQQCPCDRLFNTIREEK